jgi:hypothetical protein
MRMINIAVIIEVSSKQEVLRDSYWYKYIILMYNKRAQCIKRTIYLNSLHLYMINVVFKVCLSNGLEAK